MTSALRSGVIDIGSPICQRKSLTAAGPGCRPARLPTGGLRYERLAPARTRATAAQYIVENSPDSSGIYAQSLASTSPLTFPCHGEGEPRSRSGGGAATTTESSDA